MTRILICGSRDASDAMKDYAHRCAERAMKRDWSIIAGDALGIDATVAEAVKDNYVDLDGLPRIWLSCYGIQPAPRHGVLSDTISYGNLMGRSLTQKIRYSDGSNGRLYLRQIEQTLVTVTNYRTRDEFMVLKADCVMCIWNGTSNGTRNAYRLAIQHGKQAWLIQP